MSKKKTVITYGTFDLLHIGHIRFLRRAKLLGDYLIVGLSTDEFNESKKKKAVYSWIHRFEIISSLTFVDRIISEDTWNQKRFDIKFWEVDILVMGSDWRGKFDHLKNICEVIYLPRTPGISTSTIKERLK